MDELRIRAVPEYEAPIKQTFGLWLTESGKLSAAPLPIWRPDQRFNSFSFDLPRLCSSYNGNGTTDCNFTLNSLDQNGAVIGTSIVLFGGGPPVAVQSVVAANSLDLFLKSNKLIYGFSWNYSGFVLRLPFVLIISDIA